jgi:hypothetical protein
MMRHTVVLVSLGTGCVLTCGSLTGCGFEPAKTEFSLSRQNLERIGVAYFKATVDPDRDRPPKNKQEIIPYLKEFGNPAELLRSPDDGQDYVILWDVDVRKLSARAARSTVLAYEKQGKNGKRYVLLVREVEQMTDEQLQNASFPPGHKAP